MVDRRCNPYIDAPLTFSRLILMTLSAAVFVLEAVYGTVRGFAMFFKGRTEKKINRYHATIHRLLRIDLRLHPWLSCEVYNPHEENFLKGAIAICNHQSLLDTLCLLILSPKIVIFTSKRVWNNPVVRAVLRYAEFATVDMPVDEMLAYCRKKTDSGYTVVMFPEGERSQDCHILRFHSGAFYIADLLKADILPLYLHGAGHMLPLDQAFQNHASLYVEIGKRIPFDDGLRTHDARKQANIIRHHYEQRYNEICRKLETTAYFRHLVVELFRRVGKRRYAKKLLRQYDNFTKWIDIQLDEHNAFAVYDKTEGVFSLMLALVHPAARVVCVGSSSLRILYDKCRNLPSNLIAVDDYPEERNSQELYHVDDIVSVRILD